MKLGAWAKSGIIIYWIQSSDLHRLKANTYLLGIELWLKYVEYLCGPFPLTQISHSASYSLFLFDFDSHRCSLVFSFSTFFL